MSQIVVLCACGKPLHYADPEVEKTVHAMSALYGEDAVIVTDQGRFALQKHYIALHGVKASDLPALAEQGIARRVG